MPNLFLFEFDSYGDALRTRRYATGGGFRTGRAESPPLAAYEPRVVDAGNIEVFMFRNGTTMGSSSPGSGNVALNNADGALDFLRDEGQGGRPLYIREQVEVNNAPGTRYPTDFPVRFAGTVLTSEVSNPRVTFSVSNKIAQIAVLPVQELKYAGTNDGATQFLEGTSTDIKGLPKPVLRGHAGNFSPPLVDAPSLTYQLSSEPVDAVDAVYIGRDPMTPATVHTTLSAFLASAPSAGTYHAYLGDPLAAYGSHERACYVRLGSVPNYKVTVDATEGATPADRTVAQIARREFARKGFALNAASAAALDVACPYEVGHWQGTDEAAFSDVMDAYCVSVAAFWTSDLAGEFVVGRFGLPTAGEVAATFDERILLGLPKVKAVQNNDPNAGVPVHRVNLGYDQNYTQMSESEIAGVAIGDVGYASNPFRTEPADDPSVLVKYLNSPELNINTKLRYKPDASAQAAYFLNLHKVYRALVEVRVPSSLAAGLDLNSVFRVAGRLYRIIGRTVRFPTADNQGVTTQAVTFQAWGGIDG